MHYDQSPRRRFEVNSRTRHSTRRDFPEHQLTSLANDLSYKTAMSLCPQKWAFSIAVRPYLGFSSAPQIASGAVFCYTANECIVNENRRRYCPPIRGQ